MIILYNLLSITRFLSLVLVVIVLIPVSIYQYYIIGRTIQYLRTNRPDLIRYFYGSDLSIKNRMINVRILRWIFSKTMENDSELRDLKKVLKRNQIIIFLMLIPFSLLLLIPRLG